MTQEAPPLRVLQLGSPSGLYGAERWIMALVRHLPEALVESLVGVIKDDPALDPPLCAQAARMGVSTHVFESHGKLSWSAIEQINAFIVERRIDVLHTHGYKTDLIGLLAVRGTRCRIVSTPHGWSTNAGAKLRLYELLDRLSFPFFDAVVPLSLGLYEGLRRWPGLGRKLRLIRNGVDITEIDSTGAMSTDIELGRGERGFVIGYVGQLIQRKGISTLVRAFERLEIPGKQLVVVGDGPQRSELEALAAGLKAAGQVHFLGYRTDRLALLKQFDVFVLPSMLEGIPRCLLEAMAAGVPVIASDIPGCADLVEHGVTGLLFECGNDCALAEHLTTLWTNPSLRKSLGSAGRRKVRDGYSASAMARQYAELYLSLVHPGFSSAGRIARAQR